MASWRVSFWTGEPGLTSFFSGAAKFAMGFVQLTGVPSLPDHQVEAGL